MRLGRLDLNLLVALDRLLTLKSITQAGNEINLTQSAMSSALRRLRDYFEDPLLVQVGRRMELTPRAEALRKPVRDVLLQIEMTVATGLEFDPTTSKREFRIILSDYTLNVLMPAALAIASEEGATVGFRLLPQIEFPHAVIDRGDADALIAPGQLVSRDHPTEPLYSDTFVAAAWRDGPLGDALPEMSDAIYRNASHILMIPEPGLRSFESDFMMNLGVQRRYDVGTYTFSSLARLIVGTDKIATIHCGLARDAAKWLPLTLHKLPFDGARIEEHVQWHKFMSSDPALIWLRGLLHRAASRITNGTFRMDEIDTRDVPNQFPE
jgi:LysR family transcriptional regulator, nod-box dependent transcriptional activator|tara:strand:- start:285 stop:1256 length:972 start_codon:yes stop_codon:yes gene_type:complete